MWSVVSVLATGIAGVTNPLLKADSPQVIYLDDGTKLTLLGTTHGNLHVAPKFGNMGTGERNFYTAKNSTVVWVETEYKTNQLATYELFSRTPAVRAAKRN